MEILLFSELRSAQGFACCFLLMCSGKRIAADISSEIPYHQLQSPQAILPQPSVFGHPLLDHSPWFLEILLPPVLHHTPGMEPLSNAEQIRRFK